MSNFIEIHDIDSVAPKWIRKDNISDVLRDQDSGKAVVIVDKGNPNSKTRHIHTTDTYESITKQLYTSEADVSEQAYEDGDIICETVWYVEDIKQALHEKGLPDDNQAVMTFVKCQGPEMLQTSMTDTGWDSIDSLIDFIFKDETDE